MPILFQSDLSSGRSGLMLFLIVAAPIVAVRLIDALVRLVRERVTQARLRSHGVLR